MVGITKTKKPENVKIGFIVVKTIFCFYLYLCITSNQLVLESVIRKLNKINKGQETCPLSAILT